MQELSDKTWSTNEADRPAQGGPVLFYRIVSEYPKSSLLILTSLLFAGTAEMVGLMLLLPVLVIAGSNSGAPQSEIERILNDFFSTVGLEPTLGTLLVIIVVIMGV